MRNSQEGADNRAYLTNTFLLITFDAEGFLTRKYIGVYLNIGGTCDKNCVQFCPVRQTL